jgi:pimeloyl-ACP methyl ester carboxylesterase
LRLGIDRTGSGPPLVLLHPLGGDRSVWSPVTARLAAVREVIAVDLPGFGSSPPLAVAEPTPRALAQAVAAGLDALGIRGFEVAGNSLGGWVALELALAGSARSVVAIGPAGLWAEPLAPRRGVAHMAAGAIAPFAGLLARSARLRRLAMAGFVAHPERVPADAVARLIRAYGRSPGFAAVNAAMRANVFSGLGNIRVPVTLAWPEHDRVVTRLEHPPAGVRSVILRGCGHLPMWDDPQQVARLLSP